MDQINADVAWFNADQTRRIRPAPGPSWTDERVDLLKKRWAEGLSGRDIAAELPGMSRNAVIGKVHRLGLPRRKEHRAEVRPAKPPRKRYRRTGFGTYIKKLELVAVPILPIDDLQIPLEQRRTLVQLENHHCRWPVGEPAESSFFFCGADKLKESPYCAGHARKAYRVFEAAKYPGVA